jgi:rfaE bifunctional protein nucleotidyltransferase chain/domain
MSLHVAVSIHVRPDRLADFLALATSHAMHSRGEPGCRKFDMLVQGPLWFTLDEVFDDADALEAHRRTHHYATWRREIESMEAEPRTHREWSDVCPMRRVVVANGCWDLFGAHHLHLLTEARAQGDYLLVLVNSDRSVADLKGQGRPVVRLADRMEILRGLRCVDGVVDFDSESELVNLICAAKPAVLVKGVDHAGEIIPGAEFAGRVHLVPLMPGYSTTSTLARLRAQWTDENRIASRNLVS